MQISTTAVVMAQVALLAISALGTAQAATWYLSPAGSDANPGTRESSPWKTFAFAIPKLQPGDTLVLLDGTYTKATTGLPNVDGKKGTPSAPITITAKNERKAFLDSDGSAAAFSLRNSSYVNVIGLRGKTADLRGGKGSVFEAYNCNHITLRRLLATHNNRYLNSHTIEFWKISHALVEECECYWFHRHGISVFECDHVAVRRCYVDGRSRADLPDGRPSHECAQDRGDEGITQYWSTDGIIENCIAQSSEGIESSGQRNKLLGCISLGDNIFGFRFAYNCNGPDMDPTRPLEKHDYAENLLAINPVEIGFDLCTSVKAVVKNVTLVGAGNGFVARNIITLGHVPASFLLVNCLSLNNHGAGFSVDEKQTGGWKADHCNAFHSSPDLQPASGNAYGTWKSVSHVDPRLGPCYVYIPDGSPMKGVGKDGADIGANILCRYQDGMLTRQPLWDPATGAFPHGAVIAGVNDISGSSAFDVHRRLHVSPATLPAGYGRPPNDRKNDSHPPD